MSEPSQGTTVTLPDCGLNQEVLPQEVQVRPKPKCRLTVQMDELWSFVDHKGNEQWVTFALDAATREIVGEHTSETTVPSRQRALWQSLPPVYPRVFGGKLPPETLDASVPSSERDFWSAYPVVLPSKRHRAVGKETGKTSYIERFNCTLRQRVSRLVRSYVVVFQKVGKSHWRDLEFHPSLQCFSASHLILPSLALPNFKQVASHEQVASSQVRLVHGLLRISVFAQGF